MNNNGRHAIDNGTRYFLKGNNGKAILLVHGLTGAPAEMMFVGRRLHQKGFTVYAPLLPGHGRNEEHLVQTQWEDWYQGLDAAAEWLRSEADSVYAAGICVGGILALYLAFTRPQLLNGITIYSASFNFDGWNMPRYYRIAPYGLPVLMRIPLLGGVLKKWKFEEKHPFGIKCPKIRRRIMQNGGSIDGMLPNFPLPALYQSYRLFRKVKKILPEIHTPVQLLHAAQSDVTDLKHSYYIRKNIGGPSEVHLLYDSYHMIHVDRERRKVAEMTASYFNRYDDHV